jgi:hypothetical protein
VLRVLEVDRESQLCSREFKNVLVDFDHLYFYKCVNDKVETCNIQLLCIERIALINLKAPSYLLVLASIPSIC